MWNINNLEVEVVAGSQDLSVHHSPVVVIERHRAREEDVGQHAHGPQVHLARVGHPGQHLGSDVLGGAARVGHPANGVGVLVPIFQGFLVRQTEIGD